MAENKLVFTAEINGVERSIKSVKGFKQAISDLKKEQEDLDLGSEEYANSQKKIDGLTKSLKELTSTETELVKLNRELKEAQNAALAGDDKAIKRVAKLKNKIEDLNSSLKNVSGSGFQQVSSSISQFKEGIVNADFGKASGGLKAIGSAMKAIPIFLIVEGIRYLIENFDELSKGSGFLAKILQGVGKAIKFVTDFLGEVVNTFTDSIGATNEAAIALEKYGEEMVAANEKSLEALTETTKAFDQQAAVAKASGKSTVEIEKEKQQAIIDTNLLIAKNIEAQVRSGAEFTEDMRKQLGAATEAIAGAKVSQRLAELEDNKKKQEDYKKHLEEVAKIKKEKKDEQAKFADEENKLIDEAEAKAKKDKDDLEKQRADSLKQLSADQLNLDRQVIAEQIEGWRIEDEAKKKSIEQQKTFEQDLYNSKVQLANAGIGILSALQGFAKKGSDAQKVLAITEIAAQTGVGMIQGLVVAQKAAAGTGPAAAVAFPIFLATQIAAVLSAAAKAKSALSGGGSAALPPLPLPVIPSLPTTASSAPVIQSAAQSQSETGLDKDGNVISRNGVPIVKAIVVETDITESQRRINRLKSQSEF